MMISLSTEVAEHPPQNVFVTEDSSILLNCSFTISQPFEVYWLKMNNETSRPTCISSYSSVKQPLQQPRPVDPRLTCRHRCHCHNIMIDNSLFSDSGVYVCVLDSQTEKKSKKDKKPRRDKRSRGNKKDQDESDTSTNDQDSDDECGENSKDERAKRQRGKTRWIIKGSFTVTVKRKETPNLTGSTLNMTHDTLITTICSVRLAYQ